ncbi:MAG TPA: flagellar motor stator protein MotA [Bryobacteraceae bacterium]|jgi:chemotaxis protein MotA|nr:flagellar motor stator protein MotA [Bryobacteraceae bacterium]
MFAIIGILVVFGSVIGGFLMEHGKLPLLAQPAELLIIGGAALGTLLAANPLGLIVTIMKSLLGIIGGSRYSAALYLESLRMLNDIFQYARKSGMAKLEEDIEHPEKSLVFSKYPRLIKDHHILYFICDTLRTAVAGVVAPHDLDALVEADIEIHHHASAAPVRSLITVADALPGLGIVAAVLGIVITMGALGGPPEQLGEKVAAALVGTFLGILLSYGVVSPLASNLEKMIDAEVRYYQMLRAGLMAFAKGLAPMISVEFARRAIPHEMRPTFAEMEATCKGRPLAAAGGKGAAKAAAA